jgi:DNA-binding CsgD family transcriptional regulator
VTPGRDGEGVVKPPQPDDNVTMAVAVGARELRALGSLWSWLLSCLLLLGVAAASYVSAGSRGVEPATPGWFVLADTAVALIVLTAAVSLHGRGHHRVGRWIAGLGMSLAAYAAAAGAATVLVSPWVVAVEAAWFMVPITLAGACCLVAAEELTETPGSLRWGWLVPAGVGAGGMIVGFGTLTYERYPGVPAPLGDTALGHPALAAVFGIGSALWMLSTTIAPVLVLRGALRARGLRRGRLTIVAITAATPLLTLATCVLVSIGARAHLLDDRFATVVVSVAFCLPPALVAVGLTVACCARDDGVTGTIGRAARWVLRGLWVTITAQLAALLAALLAVGSGTPSALAASTFAVVLGVVFVAGYGPVATRIERFMAEPAADETAGTTTTDALGAAPLSGTLSPREREVLSLIAEGRSNAAIAAELVLSERTIDSHVSSIFDKLGLGREAGTNRRVQAAAAWIRADLESRGRVG